MVQIPRGPENLLCPFWQKPMEEVCHKCPMWTQLRGLDPQTGEPIPDEWNCAIGHMPKLLIENSQQSRQTGASVDKTATEIFKFHKSMVDMNNLAIASQNNQKLID